MSNTKTCIKCKKILPLSFFSKRGGENYLRTECKECNKKLIRVRTVLRAKHGPPPTGYTCPICKRNEKECRGQGSRSASSWVIDHCHKTDFFRGWLCHKCNRGLGAFNEDIGTVYEVIKYLKRTTIEKRNQSLINRAWRWATNR